MRILLTWRSGLLTSLRVNLDMGKIVYSWVIRRDAKVPGTVVRSSTIPEQLGRISYLLTDKTGECPGPSQESGERRSPPSGGVGDVCCSSVFFTL